MKIESKNEKGATVLRSLIFLDPESFTEISSVTQKKVLIDPGHSNSEPGARGKNPSITEEEMNRYQAICLKKELEKYGILVTIFDPEVDDIYLIGQKSKGYDAFVSLHLNAFDGKEHYTCAMVSPKWMAPDSKSAKVASLWASAISKTISNPLFAGSPGYPEGVMAAALGVLSGAASVGCPVAFLSEMEFIDDETNIEQLKVHIEKAMAAGAKVLSENI